MILVDYFWSFLILALDATVCHCQQAVAQAALATDVGMLHTLATAPVAQ